MDLDGHQLQFPIHWEFKVNEYGTGIPDQPLMQGYQLGQNYPNPFAVETRIPYSIPEPDHVMISVYDLNGRKVMHLVDDQHQPGKHVILLNAAMLERGIYIYRIQTDQYTSSRKMVVK